MRASHLSKGVFLDGIPKQLNDWDLKRMNDEIAKRGIKPVPVEVELSTRNGGAIRCATLVTNRADS